MPNIFISYRRKDTSSDAGRLAADLEARFGRADVFIDIDRIAPGADFEARIRHALDHSRVTFVLIGGGWLAASLPDGTRRLDDHEDLVRREVAAALARDDVAVVPVLVEGATMPTEAELPPEIAALATRNAIDLSTKRWRADVDRLCRVVHEYDKWWLRLWRAVRRRWLVVAPVAAVTVVAVVAVLIATSESGGGSSAPIPCGAGVSALHGTSCAFARNVQRDYARSKGGEVTLRSYSPTTEKTYTMHCTAETRHVCTGGNDAVVYFGTSIAADATLKSCASGASVNSRTSCAFAGNVLASYEKSYRQKGVSSQTTLSVFSPTTAKSYAMDCKAVSGTVTCTGATDALVEFPLQAARGRAASN